MRREIKLCPGKALSRTSQQKGGSGKRGNKKNGPSKGPKMR
jgi:hypothetical protein